MFRMWLQSNKKEKEEEMKEAIKLLIRTLKVFSRMHTVLSVMEVSELQSDIEDFLEKCKELQVSETEYEELDSRIQVLETFFNAVESITETKQNLS